jgi:hypothetical protein
LAAAVAARAAAVGAVQAVPVRPAACLPSADLTADEEVLHGPLRPGWEGGVEVLDVSAGGVATRGRVEVETASKLCLPVAGAAEKAFATNAAGGGGVAGLVMRSVRAPPACNSHTEQ